MPAPKSSLRGFFSLTVELPYARRAKTQVMNEVRTTLALSRYTTFRARPIFPVYPCTPFSTRERGLRSLHGLAGSGQGWGSVASSRALHTRGRAITLRLSAGCCGERTRREERMRAALEQVLHRTRAKKSLISPSKVLMVVQQMWLQARTSCNTDVDVARATCYPAMERSPSARLCTGLAKFGGWPAHFHVCCQVFMLETGALSAVWREVVLI